jgi:hypothetical protein
MRDILEEYLERIERDEIGRPRQVIPIYSKRIAINPLVSSGKPTVKGTGIMMRFSTERSFAWMGEGNSFFNELLFRRAVRRTFTFSICCG